MSRLAKKSIAVPQGVTVKHDGQVLRVKGAKGELAVRTVGVEVKVEEGKVWVSEDKKGEATPLTGTIWSLVKNAIQGVAEGFLKILEIEGVGYRAVLEGKELVLFLGYAQPVRMKMPEGVAVKIEKNAIEISGIDKDLVGRVAANIRALKKPEPYKGKGIHYRGEVIRRKVGKKAGATTGAA